ncbi:MAG: DUF2088 domain-containing protein [Lawsonibacter sp.]|nr:DUF2088 domain-containing protein [Lawsonibacter sp.]
MPILLKEDLDRPLPKLYRVRQKFDNSRLEDVAGTVRSELARPEIAKLVKPGARVAVAVGSRGIRDLYTVVSTTVTCLKELGAQPFIVSAMGSHGGGTEEGQREVLTGYGITEENLGVPVVTTVDTVLAGHCSNGRPIWFDRAAFEADLVVPVNRVKLHTDFVGPLQSGLCKMLVIGLGNHKGCSAVHEENPEEFADIIEETASIILKNAPIGFGMAILENAYDQTYGVEAVPASNFISREKELVHIAKGNMPYIMLPKADVIICREIGKDVSGAGFDPNILGRSTVLKTFVLHIPEYQRLVLTDVTPASHGNGIGVGLFDVITQKVADQLDLEAMYANAIACNCLADAFIPITVPDEETAIRVALKCCRGIDRENPKIIRIQNTLHLEYIEVSQALLPDVEADPRLSLAEV